MFRSGSSTFRLIHSEDPDPQAKAVKSLSIFETEDMLGELGLLASGSQGLAKHFITQIL